MKYIPAILLLIPATVALAQPEEDAEHRADRLRTQQLNLGAAAVVARRTRDQDAYRAARARYEREMEQWRRRAEACRAGYDDACDYR
jgi:hypothetical protein